VGAIVSVTTTLNLYAYLLIFCRDEGGAEEALEDHLEITE